MKRGVPDESTKFARGISSISFDTTGLVTTTALCIAEDQTVEIKPLPLAQPLIREVKEGPILYDRSTETPAKLITLKGRRLTGGEVEEVAGIERVVPEGTRTTRRGIRCLRSAWQC